LLQSEKVATMGALLAGVAHELNNPLAVLIGQAHLLQQGARGDEGLSRRARKIGAAAERCGRIVRNFLSLARQRAPERSSTSMSQVVQGALELLAYELRSDQVEVTVDLADDLPVLWADPHQLHQVLVNLIANAHHAMRRQSKPRHISIRAHRADGGGVRLELADTGPGIPAEVVAKIFEPFFTTKPTGEGTGLGLSLCRGIVEEHGGTLDVTSVVGEGATFVIALPAGVPPTADAESPVPRVPPASRRGTIIVVDDERAIAETVAEALETQGHTADMAENGSVALEMLERRAYDLIISDGKMPVLDGEAFWAEVGRRFPGAQQRIIFLTGDVLSREKQEFLERVGAPWLTKPFDLDDLIRLVHQMLAAPAR
jgi:CheY-like chemotaxis protein